MKVIFPTTLDVRFDYHDERVSWELLAPFVVIVTDVGQRIVRVPSGFRTDFSSIPRLPFIFLAYGNKAHLASLAHDFLYHTGGSEEDRLYADRVFLYGMMATGVPEHDAQSMYDGVRAFGTKFFNKSIDVSPG